MFVILTVGVMPEVMKFLTTVTMLYNGDMSVTPPEIMAAWANVASSVATMLSLGYLFVFYLKNRELYAFKCVHGEF